MFFWMYILILTDYLINEDQTIRFHISWSQVFFSLFKKYHKIISNKGWITIKQKNLMKSQKMYLPFQRLSI